MGHLATERPYSFVNLVFSINVIYKNTIRNQGVKRMWSVQSDKIKQHKKRVNYTINKHTIDRFKIVADKDMRKMSNIVET